MKVGLKIVPRINLNASQNFNNFKAKALAQLLLRLVYICVIAFIYLEVQSQNLEWQNAGTIPIHHSGGGRSVGVAELYGKIYLAGGYCGPHCEGVF